jgi:hypothetical protein
VSGSRAGWKALGDRGPAQQHREKGWEHPIPTEQTPPGSHRRRCGQSRSSAGLGSEHCDGEESWQFAPKTLARFDLQAVQQGKHWPFYISICFSLEQ